MGAADARTIEAGTPGAVLMDRAGRAVARSAIRVLGGRYGRRAVVVCGKGNNGGDGFVAARELARQGVRVRCIFVGDPAEVKGDAAQHRDAFVAGGGRVETFRDELGPADVLVDALFGTGFKGSAEGAAAAAIDAMNEHSAPTIAVDIPSGVDGTTGAVRGPATDAHTTVVMGAQKLGTATGAGAERAGDIEVVDIGIPVDEADGWEPTASDVDAILPRRGADAHKRSVGSVAILGGSEGMSGAVILTARGAVRTGAGYATVGLSRTIEPTVSAVLPEVLTKILTDEPHLVHDAWTAFKEIVDRADSIAVGPGLGDGDEQQALVRAVLEEASQPVVVDADGLNVLARDTSPLEGRSAPTVLTPHPAELARLLRTETSAVQDDRVTAARNAAERFGCTVVLKGYRSVIADSSGRIFVNSTGSPHLATAGTGDVLTGVIAALVAAGLGDAEAAWAGAHVHGVAGEVAAARNDGHGVVAWDVAEAIPQAIAVTEAVAWD
jgi:NAD(P)H-hydrate epimerase